MIQMLKCCENEFVDDIVFVLSFCLCCHRIQGYTCGECTDMFPPRPGREASTAESCQEGGTMREAGGLPEGMCHGKEVPLRKLQL